MIRRDGLDDGLLRDRLARLGRVFALRLEVVDVEAQDVPVLDGVGEGVDVELLLEQVRRGAHGGLLVLDLLESGIGLEDGRAGEAEKLALGEELLDSLVILPELGAVALVEDEDDGFVTQRVQHLLVSGLVVLLPLLVALAGFIQRQSELLDGGDDDLVGIVLVTVVAVVGVDADLVDDLEGVLTPVFEVDEGVVQRRAVVAGEGVDLLQGLGGGEDIQADNFV